MYSSVTFIVTESSTQVCFLEVVGHFNCLKKMVHTNRKKTNKKNLRRTHSSAVSLAVFFCLYYVRMYLLEYLIYTIYLTGKT